MSFFIKNVDHPVYNFIKQIKRRPLALVALGIILIYILIAIIGEGYSIYCKTHHITPIYEQGSIENKYQPPSSKFILGSDYKGRSVFLRAVMGIRTAIKIGFFASLLSTFIGVTLGLFSGYFGGWVDDIVVWVYSTFASMPTLLFILSFSLLFSEGFLTPTLNSFMLWLSDKLYTSPGMLAVYLAIGLTGWVSLCRIIRAETMKLRNCTYIQAGISLGLSAPRLIRKHILPNLFHLIIIYFTIRFSYAIMTEVIVSYLGLGVEQEPSWGNMISNGQEQLWRGVWWEVGAATLFMFVLVLSFHLLSDALQDILNPKER